MRNLSNPVNPPAVSPPGSDWDKAFLRVESYLRAHHLESRLRLNQLTTEIIEEARVLAAAEPDQAPVALAMRVTEGRIGSWLARIFGPDDPADDPFRTRGRVAFVLAELSDSPPPPFLSEEIFAPDSIRPSVSGPLEPGPELRLSNMAPAPLEFAFDPPKGGPSRTFHRGSFFRAAAAWLAIVGLLGVAWAGTH